MTHSRTEVTHTGDYFGVAPTGKRLAIEEVLSNRIASGQIAESWRLSSGD